MNKLLKPLKLLKIFKQKKFIFLAILVLAGLGFFIFRQTRPTPQVQLATVERHEINETVPASGTLDGSQSATLRFQTGGKLATLNVKEGDRVTQGQVIASLDQSQLFLSLQQAQNNLADKEATLQKVLDDIHLYQYGNGGFSNVGSANETQLQRATRISAEEAVNIADATVKSDQVAVNNSVITSPINGIVTAAKIIPGQTVSSADVIAQVVDDSGIYFDGEVDEGDIGKVLINQPVNVTLNTYGDRVFKGYVSRIIPTTTTTTSGATVIITKIKLDNPGISLITNLNGQAAIITKQKSNVLTVPTESLVDDTHVYVDNNGQDVLTEIKTGISSDTLTEVLSGLSENQKVVTNPSVIKK